MVFADSKAAEGVGKAASGGDDFIVFVVHGADVIQVGIPADSFLV